MNFKCSIGFHDWVYDNNRRTRNNENIIYLGREDIKRFKTDYINLYGAHGDRVCARCDRIELNYTNAHAKALSNLEDNMLKKDKAMAKLDSFREISSKVDDL